MSSQSGKLNLLLFLFVFFVNSQHILLTLSSFSQLVQCNTSLFLTHKFNLYVVIYFNISDLHIFNNYLVNLFLSISHRLELFFLLVMKSSAETSLLLVSMSFSKTVFPVFLLCIFSVFNKLSSHLIIFISLSECSASTWSFAVVYISIWDLSFFP